MWSSSTDLTFGYMNIVYVHLKNAENDVFHYWLNDLEL